MLYVYIFLLLARISTKSLAPGHEFTRIVNVLEERGAKVVRFTGNLKEEGDTQKNKCLHLK